MKEIEFKKSAIDILGQKYYDAFDGMIYNIAKECCIKLFLKEECVTERAYIIRKLMKEFNERGWVEWN